QSLGTLIDDGKRTDDLARLENAPSKLRVTRMPYLAANGDAVISAQGQEQLDASGAEQRHHGREFAHPEDPQTPQPLPQIIADYQVTLDSMRDAFASRSAALQSMNQLANQLVEVLAALQNQAQRNEDEQLVRAIDAFETSFLQVRFDSRMLMTEGSAEAEQAYSRAVT